MVNIIGAILSPAFLTSNIELISLVLAVMVLTIFDDFVMTKIVFPVTDFIREKTAKILGEKVVIPLAEKIKEKIKKSIGRRSSFKISRFIAEILTTILFILYFYAGYILLAEYIFEPILTRLKDIILILVLVIFILISLVLNRKELRKRFLGY